MRDKHATDYWQSFADLAMGLMAVILLILVILLVKVRDDAQETSAQKQELEKFTLLLLQSIADARAVEQNQDRVGDWLSLVFEETGCRLEYDANTGKLRPRDRSGAAELYEPGDTELSERAQKDLASCMRAFVTLMACLSPDEETRASECDYSTPESAWALEAEAFRKGIEALVLQGNTDRAPTWSAKAIKGLRRALHEPAQSYVYNSYLGSERARQALGHLLAIVGQQAEPADERSSFAELFMARARVESASFGRYQVGPVDWREHGCSLDDSERDCPEARNLALQLRWRRTSLRQPFKKVVLEFCAQWMHSGSHIQQTIERAGRAKMAQEVCAEAMKEKQAAEVSGT